MSFIACAPTNATALLLTLWIILFIMASIKVGKKMRYENEEDIMS